MKEIGFSYGIMCENLETQANQQGYTLGKNVELAEKLRKSYNMLCIHGILTNSQANRCLPKLHKKIVKMLEPLESENSKNGGKINEIN